MTRPNLEIIRGDSQVIDLQVAENGAGIDLTGATVFFTAKTSLDGSDGSAAISVEVTDFDDPTSGTVTIELSATDTDITPGVYFYDIQIVYGDGVVTSLPYGMLRVKPDVKRGIS